MSKRFSGPYFDPETTNGSAPDAVALPAAAIVQAANDLTEAAARVEAHDEGSQLWTQVKMQLDRIEEKLAAQAQAPAAQISPEAPAPPETVNVPPQTPPPPRHGSDRRVIRIGRRA